MNSRSVLTSILLLLAAAVLGWAVAFQPMGIPLYFSVSLLVVTVSIIDIRIGMGLLILSMLLSPEIKLAEVPSRAVVVRFDDLILILVFFVWLLKTAINNKLPLIKTTPINKYIYLYIGACFLFTIKGIIEGNVDPSKAMFYLLKYTEYFIVFWMTYNIIESRKDIKVLMGFAVATALAVIAYGYTKIGTRVVAPFDNEPASVGGYLTLLSAVGLGTAVYHNNKKIKIFAAGLSLLSVPLFMMSKSRASYLAFIVMFSSIIILTAKYRKTLILSALAGVLAIPILTGDIYNSFTERVKYTFSGQFSEMNLDPSSAARLISWAEEIFNKWPEKPFAGWGVTGRGFIDSQYVRVLVETGIIGFLLFILLLFYIFKYVYKIYKKTELHWTKGLSLGFLAAFIGLIFHALTSNTFIIVRIMEPFWFLLAVVMSFPEAEELYKNKTSTSLD